MGGHVLARHLRDDPGPHAQEGADRVERQPRRVDQVPVAQDEDLLPREQPEQPLKLLAIPAEAGVMPERRPARRDPALLGRARGREVPDGIQPGGPQVRPVGVRPLDRITQDRDHPGARDQRMDPLLRPAVVQVEGGRLAAQRAGRRGVEQRLIVLPPPYVLAVGLHVAGPAATPRRWAVGEEELGFLDRGHEQPGMPGQGRVQGGGASLGGADHEEIWPGHGGDLLSTDENPSIPINLIVLDPGGQRSSRGAARWRLWQRRGCRVHAAPFPFRRVAHPTGSPICATGMAAATTGEGGHSRELAAMTKAGGRALHPSPGQRGRRPSAPVTSPRRARPPRRRWPAPSSPAHRRGPTASPGSSPA